MICTCGRIEWLNAVEDNWQRYNPAMFDFDVEDAFVPHLNSALSVQRWFEFRLSTLTHHAVVPRLRDEGGTLNHHLL
jgi:hypothetical protein